MAKEKIKPEVGQIWKHLVADYRCQTISSIDSYRSSYPINFAAGGAWDADMRQMEFVGWAPGYGPQPPEPKVDGTNTTGYRAAEWLRKVAETLEQKSISYGDSVGKPLRIFSKADSSEGIRVRLDDKLSRIANGGRWPGDNDLGDFVGYVALLAVTEDKK